MAQMVFREVQRLIRKKQNKKYEKEATAAKPPTPSQRNMLKYLGFEGSIQNRLEASEMISKLKGERE